MAHEHAEEPDISWVRGISLSTALFAVVAAVAALQSGALETESLLQSTEAVRSQAKASDQWSYYQAKGIKANNAVSTADVLSTVAAPSAAVTAAAQKYRALSSRYEEEQKDIKNEAEKLENEIKEHQHDSERLLHNHHIFAYSVTFTQVAIALSAIAALTRRRQMWFLSMAVGLIGFGYFAYGYWLMFGHHGG